MPLMPPLMTTKRLPREKQAPDAVAEHVETAPNTKNRMSLMPPSTIKFPSQKKSTTAAAVEGIFALPGPPHRPPQAIYCPAITDDYFLKNDETTGIGLVARRNIKKGEPVFLDTIEYIFCDVIEEGDYLLLEGHRKASRKSKTKIPPTIPVTREMLLETHGVPCIFKPDPTGEYAGLACWALEVPGMFCNHSCDPNVEDDDPRDLMRGEARAARDIKRGEELTYSYAQICYTWNGHDWGTVLNQDGDEEEEEDSDDDSSIDSCHCGSSRCYGKMVGFKELSPEDQQRLFPKAIQYVQAMYKADTGEGLPVKYEQTVFSAPCQAQGAAYDGKDANVADHSRRLVFPGPSYALADVGIWQEEGGAYALYALKDFAAGDVVYEFWRTDWPFSDNSPIDMVAPTKLSEGDLPEGTVVRVDPSEYPVRKHQSTNSHVFSGWDMLTQHSSDDANLAYKAEEDEEYHWLIAFAMKEIKAGDKLSANLYKRIETPRRESSSSSSSDSSFSSDDDED